MRTYALVPAAGQSRRMGQPKLLLPWGDDSVLDAVLRAWRAGGVDECWVVLAPEAIDRERLEEIARRHGAQQVIPSVAPPTMRASVEAALAAIELARVPSPDDGWLLAPADLPQLSVEAVAALCAAHCAQPAMARVAVFGSERAHPVLFPWAWRTRVRALAADAGLNQLVREGPTELHVFPADPWQRVDLDRPDDYRRLHDHYIPCDPR